MDYHELGAWSLCKRTLTRRWTSQICEMQDTEVSSHGASVGGPTGEETISDIDEIVEPFALPGSRHPKILPSGVAKVAVPQLPWVQRLNNSSDRANTGAPGSIGSSAGRNSGIMVEEERPNWLQELGSKDLHLSDWTRPSAASKIESKVEQRRTSPVPSTSKDGDVRQISIDE